MPAITCPRCGTGYDVPASAVGKTATCKKCGTKFGVPASTPTAARPAPPPVRPSPPVPVPQPPPDPVPPAVPRDDFDTEDDNPPPRRPRKVRDGYPALSFVSRIFFLVGVLHFVAGVLSLLIGFLAAAAHNEFGSKYASDVGGKYEGSSGLGLVITGMYALGVILLGTIWIAAAEVLRWMIDVERTLRHIHTRLDDRC